MSRLRIETLHVRNFRGIDELTLDLRGGEEAGGGLAVLAGDNGCGKTSVLEAILLVLGQTQLLPDDAAPLGEQVRFGAGEFVIEAEVSPVPDGVTGPLRVTPAILRQPTVQATFYEGGAHDIPNGPFWRAIHTLRPSVEYYSARRTFKALGEAPSQEAARTEREARRIGELKRRLISTYYRSLRDRQRAPNGPSPFERLQAFLRPFLGEEWTLDVIPVSNDPGSGDDVVVRRGDLPSDLTSIAMARAAAVGRDDVPTLVPIEHLSSGQQALLAFAGPLLFRDVPVNLVLIDEPEQHMHAKWQRAILPAVQALTPESQIIVATHSLEVLDTAMSYERHLLLSEDDPRAAAWNRPGAADDAAGSAS